MGPEDGRSERIRSGIFVDFDNIFIRFKQQYNEDIARSFACNPEQWVAWIGQNAAGPCEEGRSCRRKLLVRRCYMNPEKFSIYRRKFTQAAFEVIDCPPLTEQGKTSTDIHLVMDVLDALAHPMHLDEFIILSGDADFTPLLLRLRKYDRFTAIFCAGHASAAYKASSDSIIPVEGFISGALGMSREVRPNGVPAPQAEAASLTAPVMPTAAGGGMPGGTSGSGSLPAPPPPSSARPPGENAAGPIDAPKPNRRPVYKSSYPRLGFLVSKIHKATGIHKLTHTQYAVLFEELADEINFNGVQKEATTRAVQERCAKKKISVLHEHVDAVISGCNRADYWFVQGKVSAEAIAQGYLRHIRNLCRTENVRLSEFELEMLHQWITGASMPGPGDSLAN